MRTSTLAFGIGLALSGSVLAQNPSVQSSGAATVHAGQAIAPAAQSNEINATLTSSVDARRAKSGDEITAALAEDTQTGGQLILRRGTKLVGHVTEAQARGRRSNASAASVSESTESRLGIVFDKAVLEDGREVPLHATIQAIAVSEAAASGKARYVESAAGGSVLGSGRVSSSGPLGGGGIVGGVTGTAGSALGGAPNVGAGLGVATAGAGLASRASQGAVGGLSAGGQLTAGSRGAFGMSSVDIVSTAGDGSLGSSVLTSRSGNIGLERGMQLVLVNQTTIERAPRE